MARTLQASIEFEGIGLHSGNQARLRLSPCERQGIFFRTATGEHSISKAVVEEDNRLTGFKLPDGSKVRTAEHLLAAIVGMGLQSVVIELEGEEVPILDGSAHPFAQKIAEAGVLEKGTPVPARFVSVPVTVDDQKNGKYVAAIPSAELRITYIIDYPGTPIGVQRMSCAITDTTFLDIISRARTFGLISEIDYLKSHGLAKGGSLANAMLFDEDKLLNEDGLRYPQEPVSHKAVDLLGDLALLGFVPTAHYIAICAGHGTHRLLTDKLRKIFNNINCEIQLEACL